MEESQVSYWLNVARGGVATSMGMTESQGKRCKKIVTARRREK